MKSFKVGDLIKGREVAVLSSYGPFIFKIINEYDIYDTYEIYDIKRKHIYYNENIDNYEFLVK